MKGSVNSILVGLVAVSIGMGFGILLGSLAAFYKGWMDEVIMRISDVLYGFPAVLSAILITSILGPGIVNSMIAIGIFNIPIFARLTRATSLSLWSRDYVTSARAIGRSDSGIIMEIHPSQHPLCPGCSGDGSICDCDSGGGRSELSGIRDPAPSRELGKDAQ